MAAAQRAGFKKGDVLISFDGRTDLPRETDVLAHALTMHKPGERVAVTVLRDGETSGVDAADAGVIWPMFGLNCSVSWWQPIFPLWYTGQHDGHD